MIVPTVFEISTLRQLYWRTLGRLWIFRPVGFSYRTARAVLRWMRESTFEMISTREFLESRHIPYHVLIPTGEEVVPEVQFHVPSNANPHPVAGHYLSPECYCFPISNANVIARSDFVIVDGKILYPDHYEPRVHLSTFEQLGVGKVDVVHNRVRTWVGRSQQRIARGINLLSGGAGNYAHFLSEVIPRLLAVDRAGLYPDLPLVVDGWIGARLLEALEYFNINKRPLIKLKNFEGARVDELIQVSSPSFAPQDFRSNILSTEDLTPERVDGHYLFSSEAMNLVREYVQRLEPAIGQKSGERIYIRRGRSVLEGVQYNTQRQIVNLDEVEACLERHGFLAVDPALITFREQVTIFSHARIVVSPLGAALANLMFARPGAVVLGLGAYYVNADYSYHARLMSALGHIYHVVAGPQVLGTARHPMHRSYKVNPEVLDRTLKEILSKSLPEIVV